MLRAWLTLVITFLGLRNVAYDMTFSILLLFSSHMNVCLEVEGLRFAMCFFKVSTKVWFAVVQEKLLLWKVDIVNLYGLIWVSQLIKVC